MSTQTVHEPPEGEIADAEIVPDTMVPANATTELVRRERRSEVIRPLNAEAVAESFADYQALLPKLLNDSDYQNAGGGRRFVKKSGWRKIATAFDLDVTLVGAPTVEFDDNAEPLRARVIARAIAPSGRAMDGDGYCSATEPRFARAKGREKLYNDLVATATTRAKNRAISDLVGMGDVSAEEVDATPTPVAEVVPWTTPLVIASLTTLAGGDTEKAGAAMQWLTEHGWADIQSQKVLGLAARLAHPAPVEAPAPAEDPSVFSISAADLPPADNSDLPWEDPS